MKGFSSRSTVEETIRWIDATTAEIGMVSGETIVVGEACSRVLNEDCISPVNVPSFDRSMMDGYALRGEETYGATSYNPLQLRIVGSSLPGVPFQRGISAGEAVRIMTGAPMPSGSDAVLPVEQTETSEQTLHAMGEVAEGKHVGRQGEDVKAGTVVLRRGRELRPQDIGLLSSVGFAELKVIKRPRVRILITGNELLPAGSLPSGQRIVDSNGPMLRSLVERDGGEAIVPELIPDNREALAEAMAEAADCVLVSGGSSVGQDDHAPSLLAELGELAIHGIAMRPSSPAGMGLIGDKLVFLLPGNPVSCLCAYDFFAGRAIRQLGGRRSDWPYRVKRAQLTGKLVSTVGRVDYARVKMSGEDAEPLAISGASVLSSTTRADGFVVIPADSEGYPSGTGVDVFVY